MCLESEGTVTEQFPNEFGNESYFSTRDVI